MQKYFKSFSNLLDKRLVGVHGGGCEDEAGVGGGVLRGELPHGLEVAGVGHDRRHLLQLRQARHPEVFVVVVVQKSEIAREIIKLQEAVD